MWKHPIQTQVTPIFWGFFLHVCNQLKTLTMITQSTFRSWVISRLSDDNLLWVDVNSFRSRIDAEQYLQLLKNSRPDIRYQITFRRKDDY